MKPLIYAQHLTKTYGSDPSVVYAVNDITLGLYEGDFTVILGRSGSGKSTLLHILAGLLPPDEGSVQLDDISVYALSDHARTLLRRRSIGFIFQFFNLLPTENVIENIVLPLHLDRRKEDSAYIDTLLKELGIEDKRYAWIHELSGGQQQRTAIARALALRPRIIFADEPTGNLDKESAQEVISLLQKSCLLHHQTIVMVTHDESAAALADRVIRLEDGHILSDIRNTNARQ